MRGPTGAAGAEAYRLFSLAGAAGSTAARYLSIVGNTVQASEPLCKRAVPRATTFSTLRVYFATAYATANATLTLRVNGVDTALTGVISAGGQTLTVTGSVGVAANDAISVKIQLDAIESNATLGVSAVIY
jgi:hypothetical protein